MLRIFVMVSVFNMSVTCLLPSNHNPIHTDWTANVYDIYTGIVTSGVANYTGGAPFDLAAADTAAYVYTNVFQAQNLDMAKNGSPGAPPEAEAQFLALITGAANQANAFIASIVSDSTVASFPTIFALNSQTTRDLFWVPAA